MILDNMQWKPFKIKDIFEEIYIAKSNDLNKLRNGDVPFIGRSDMNNGFQGMVETTSIEEGNCISVGMVGTFKAHYQEVPFTCSQNIMILRGQFLNKKIALFLNCILNEKLLNKFSYGKSIKITTFGNEKIMLPVKNEYESKPQWSFMEKYIEKCIENNINQYKIFNKRIMGGLEYRQIPSLDRKCWKEFNIDDLFYIESGKRLTKKNMIKGEIPFIGSTDSNNGITNFVSNVNESLDSNVLGVNYNGSVCESFYHSYKCIFSDDVKRFKLKNIKGNKYVYLFFKTIILNQKNKYTYAYKFNSNRMKRQRIMVPVTNNLEPDYEYMEQYIKNLMISKYEQYNCRSKELASSEV